MINSRDALALCQEINSRFTPPVGTTVSFQAPPLGAEKLYRLTFSAHIDNVGWYSRTVSCDLHMCPAITPEVVKVWALSQLIAMEEVASLIRAGV